MCLSQLVAPPALHCLCFSGGFTVVALSAALLCKDRFFLVSVQF